MPDNKEEWIIIRETMIQARVSYYRGFKRNRNFVYQFREVMDNEPIFTSELQLAKIFKTYEDAAKLLNDKEFRFKTGKARYVIDMTTRCRYGY